jgi:hypothetical protein
MSKRKTRNGMEQREPGHREARYAGEGYDSDGSHGDGENYSGSPAHVTMTHGPGPVPGAGEQGLVGGPGPGRAGRVVRPDPVENPIRQPASGASPKGDRRDGGEED